MKLFTPALVLAIATSIGGACEATAENNQRKHAATVQRKPTKSGIKKQLNRYSWHSKSGATPSDKMQQWENWRKELTALLNSQFSKMSEYLETKQSEAFEKARGSRVGVRFVVRANKTIDNVIVGRIEQPLQGSLQHMILWASANPALKFPITDENAVIDVKGVLTVESPIRFEPETIQLTYLSPKRRGHLPDILGKDYSRHPPTPLRSGAPQLR